jgi:predicted ATPase
MHRDNHGWLLAKTISRLFSILGGTGVEDEVLDIKNEVALEKLTITCGTFICTVTCPGHPIVLVLDDIQWIDKGSRQLLEVLLVDTDLENVLLVLIYCKEEQELALDLLQNTKLSSLRKVDINVDGLSADGIHQIIVSWFKDIESSGKSEALSLLVYQWTHGNEFHVLGFLDYIKSEDLLTLESENPSIWESM